MPLALLLAAALAHNAPVSPAVRPVTRSFAVDLRSKVISFEVPLIAADGQAYLFWCEGGTDFAGLNALAERHLTRQSGALMCVLNEGGQRDEGSLLSDGDEAPWFSRAMFRSEHLANALSGDPALGRVRTFRVRGMLLTLTASRVKSDAKGVRAFTLDVSIQPAATDAPTVAGNRR